MTNKVKPVPDGFHTATPYLVVNDGPAALDYYAKAFGATEYERMTDANGKIRHCGFRIGDSPFMMTEEVADYPDYLGPLKRGGSSLHIYLYVENVDEVFNRAIAAGATETMPVTDQFYGDRSGGLKDPFGHVWYVATRIEDLSPEELKRRASAAQKG